MVGGVSAYDYHNFKSDDSLIKEFLIVRVEGRLFNIETLQNELDLISNSNEEIVAAAYTKWGKHFIDQIEGTFFIVIFDQEKRELLLYRDKIGVVPCY